MAIVVFDVDDVIFPFKSVVVKTLNRRFGTKIRIEDYIEFSFISLLKRNHTETYDMLEKNGSKLGHFKYISDSGLLLSTPPILGAIDAFKELEESDFKIGIVTYRGTTEDPDMHYKDAPGITTKWLQMYGLNFQAIRFTNKKAEALKQIEEELDDRVVAFVEDHPANIIDVANAGYNVIIQNTTYNKRILPLDLYDPTAYGLGTFKNEDWFKVLDSELIYRTNLVQEVPLIVKKFISSKN